MISNTIGGNSMFNVKRRHLNVTCCFSLITCRIEIESYSPQIPKINVSDLKMNVYDITEIDCASIALWLRGICDVGSEISHF